MDFLDDNQYNFHTISNTILKGEYRNYKFVGNLTYKQVLLMRIEQIDIPTIRQNLILELGTPLLEVTKVRYYIFEGPEGNTVLLAADWITTDSIEEAGTTTATYIFTNLSAGDLVNINNVLSSLKLNFTREIE